MLFIEENHEILINPELKLFPEFRRIIERDKDRFKKRARQELTFIYFACDYKSPYLKNTSESERFQRVAKELRFEVGYKPDADLIYAMERYKALQKTATTETLQSIREGLMTSNKVVNVLRNQIDEAIKDPVALAANPVAVVELVKQLNALLDLSNNIPKTVTTIENLEAKVKAEQSSTKTKLKGGGDKGEFED